MVAEIPVQDKPPTEGQATPVGKGEAAVVWRGGMQFEGIAPSGHRLMLDSAPEVGGADAGLRPMELVLLALAGCTAMDVISILRKKRQDVTGFEVRVRSERAQEHPKVYTHIALEYIVRGRNISPEAVARAITLSKEKYCSVHAMLRSSVPIAYGFRIEEDGGQKTGDGS
ncbi:MAG: osmotically inducible protein OsmC [Chloroflexota bacterium]